MNLRFLGDALDHWKGSLFEQLQQSGALCNLMVDTMASDQAMWQPGDYEVFARLLRIERSQLIRHRNNLHNRDGYFIEISSCFDVFLDPDTGVATGRVPDGSQYVMPEEIRKLLDQSERIVAVYQHVRAMATSARVDNVCQCVQQVIGDIHWVSYESANVAIIFFSNSVQRLGLIAETLQLFLGNHARKRVRMSLSVVR